MDVITLPGFLNALVRAPGRVGIQHFGLIRKFADHNLGDDLIDLGDQGV